VYIQSKELEREIEGKIAEFLKVYSESGADTGEVSLHVLSIDVVKLRRSWPWYSCSEDRRKDGLPLPK
jgi:hypothetical protein